MPLIPFSRSSPRQPPPPDHGSTISIYNECTEFLSSVHAQAGFALGSAVTFGGMCYFGRYGKRIKNSKFVTPVHYGRKIKGTVTAVGDGDNFRLYHMPGFGWRGPLKFRSVPSDREALKDQTIHIRLAGVDAPEGSYFGNPGQPFAEESRTWLRKETLGKVVHCELRDHDHYGRIVAVVTLPRAFGRDKDLQLEMLKAGWATVYKQAGAQYGKQGQEVYVRAEAKAKERRRGIWKHGELVETPAEYKRRIAKS